MDEPEKLMTEAEAAAHLTALGFKVSAVTLARYAKKGKGGPSYTKPSRARLYAKPELATWLAEQRVEVGA